MIVDRRKLTPKYQIAEGGEALIYSFTPKKVMKIYKNVSKDKEKKLESLMSKFLPKEVIVPTDLVYDSSGNFLGYEMNKFDGDELKMLSNKKYRLSNNITVKTVAEILRNIQETLRTIHIAGFSIGDLNNKNILFKGTDVAFIDTDSWVIPPYTCDVCMDSFKDPLLHDNSFNEKTDNYAFAILSFLSITKLHPFGGTYSKDPNMSMIDRMKKGISVINDDVIIPKSIGDYRILSPELIELYNKVFTDNERSLIDLYRFAGNLKYCDNKKDYCSGVYLDGCPVCSTDPKIYSVPTAIVSSDGLSIEIVFERNDVKFVIDEFLYMATNGNVKSTVMNNREMIIRDKIVMDPLGRYFADCDKSFFLIGDIIPKQYKSDVKITHNYLYYITDDLKFNRLKMENNAKSVHTICTTSFNSIFEAVTNINTKEDHHFVCNIYEHNKIISIDGFTYILHNKEKIVNYGIHYNHSNDKWLFVFEDTSGKFYLYILYKNTLQHENSTLKFSCSLSSISFHGDGIFIPKDGEIRGYNYKKNVYVDIKCDIVDESCSLKRYNGYFIVITEKKIYKVKK